MSIRRSYSRIRSAERAFERLALRRKQCRSVIGNEHVVLETDAELTGDVNARLVAEHHARTKRQLRVPAEHVVLDEIWPLMHIHAQAMAKTVSEELIARAVSC